MVHNNFKLLELILVQVLSKIEKVTQLYQKKKKVTQK